MKEIVAGWNRDYFGGELSQACLAEFDQIDAEDRELVDFADTWLFYFHMAGGRAKDCSPLGSRFFAKIAKSYMPSLWAKIPPITRGRRLRVIDRVVHEVLGIPSDQAIDFLDVGCGYPPVTTVETAELCPAWTCVGIDPNFPASILFDSEGTGACFDEAGTLVYIQYLGGDLQPDVGRVERDRERFALEWDKIQGNPSLREELIRGERLAGDPIKHYEGRNLTFRAGTLTGLGAYQTFDLIRCMNVFMYFAGQGILENIRHAKSLLGDSGMFICGSVPEGGAAARYLAYQKCGTALVPRLFGMDLGKLSQRDGNGWWAFHKDQPDPLFLAKVVRLVSDDRDRFGQVSSVVDRLEHEFGYSHRDPDGYLHLKGFLFNTSDNDRLSRTLAEECGHEIAAFLGRMGFCAQITPFGHLAIDFSHSQSEHYAQYFPVL